MLQNQVWLLKTIKKSKFNPPKVTSVVDSQWRKNTVLTIRIRTIEFLPVKGASWVAKNQLTKAC